MSEDEDMGADFSFAEIGLLAVDRAQRMLDQLRDQLRLADEYLLKARAAERGAVIIERVTVNNHNVQSIGVTVSRDSGSHLTINVAHRGAEGVHLIGPGESEELEV